jgi:hypothetical protein
MEGHLRSLGRVPPSDITQARQHAGLAGTSAYPRRVPGFCPLTRAYRLSLSYRHCTSLISRSVWSDHVTTGEASGSSGHVCITRVLRVGSVVICAFLS